MIKWKKPSGAVIETNDMPETVDACLSMDWQPLLDGRPVDVEEDFDASGELFDPERHWKNRRKDADGNWMVKKA